MGLLEDMLKNTDHYEHFMTPNALNILEEIRTSVAMKYCISDITCVSFFTLSLNKSCIISIE